MSNTFDESSMFFDETTSPNQLQEVTFGEPHEPGLVPATKPSPIRGRSMKEYEERLAQLRKENFNLKLRIYFLEERMGQIHDIKDKEEAIRRNIELKVEAESLRKDLSDKQELLCQAAKALELLEEQSKEEKSKHGQETANFESRIQELEKELQEYSSAMQQMKLSQYSAMTQSTDSQYSSACFEVDQLNAQVQELQEQLKEQKEVVAKYETDLRQKEASCESMQAELHSQVQAVHVLEELVGVKQPDLLSRVKQLLECEQELREKECQLSVFQEQLATCKDDSREVESKLSKERANAANLTAKFNTASLELQRLREEVKKLKKSKQDMKKLLDQGKTSSETLALKETELLLQEQKQKVQELQDKLDVKEKDIQRMCDSHSSREKKFATLKEQHDLAVRAVKGLVEDQKELKKRDEDLRNQLILKDQEIQQLSSKLNELVPKESTAVANLHKDFTCEKDSVPHIQSVEASLREKEAQLAACEQQLETRDNRIVELQHEVETLLSQLKEQTEKHLKSSDNNLATPSECGVPQEVLLNELLLKKKEIETLNLELKKRTYNLQELVNKELWDKNKQIERLELRLTAQSSLCDKKELELKEAKRKLAEFGVTVISLSEGPGFEAASEDVSRLQEQLKLSFEEQKYLTKQIDELKKKLRNTPERDSESKKVVRLQEENRKLKAEEENNRVWKREAAKALSVLRTRLEELAVFLDELLHQPTLVVGLCADRQRALRAVINGSLELSRTIANLSGDSWPTESHGSPYFSSTSPLVAKDKSAEHFLSCGGMSCDSVFESPSTQKLVEDSEVVPKNLDSISLALISSSDDVAFESSLCNFQADTAAVLDDGSCAVRDQKNKQDICVLPSSSEMRKRSRSHHNKVQSRLRENAHKANAGSQSDSDTWSEPDRSVSQARMGINNDSTRTVSSAASTIRKKSVGSCDSHSSSSSADSKARHRATVNSAFDSDALKANEMQNLAARTQCLEQLNEALQTELRIGSQNGVSVIANATADNAIVDPAPSSLLLIPPPSGSSKDSAVSKENILRSHDLRNQLEWERSARIAWQQRATIKLQQLQDKVSGQERQLKEKDSDLQNLKHSLLEVTNEAETKEYLSSQKRIHLEDKVQELSVQVLEVEVRREQAEQDAQKAIEDRERMRKELEIKVSALQKQEEEARREANRLRSQVEQLTSEKSALENQAEGWREKVRQMEKDLEEWKLIAQKYEMDVKEAQVQLSRDYKDKLQMLETSKQAAEQRSDAWHRKCQESEKKRADVERRAREKIRLLEEQVKLKKVELERRAEEQLEKLKREMEARASRKLEEAVEVRILETRDAEAALRSRLDDVEKKASVAAADAEQRARDLEEQFKMKESSLNSRLAEAERRLSEESDLRRQLDEAAVAASQAQLETAKLANEKLQLEQHVRWLQGEAARDRKQLQEQLTRKLLSLNHANIELQTRVKDLEREIHIHQHSRRKGGSSQTSSSSPASPESKVLTEITNLRRHRSTDMSDYVSEEQEQDETFYPRVSYNCWYRDIPRSPPTVMLTGNGNPVSVSSGIGRTTTASPDLGIESDQGRFSSLEPHPLQKSTTAPALHTGAALSSALDHRRKQQLDYHGLEQENVELKQRLQHTRQTLEQTYAQLAAANQRKRLVEKAICRQLNKTHHILRRARDNFESSAPSVSQTDEPVS